MGTVKTLERYWLTKEACVLCGLFILVNETLNFHWHGKEKSRNSQKGETAKSKSLQFVTTPTLVLLI